VRDHDHGDSEHLVELLDQVVDFRRSDRIEARRRFVEVDDVGVEGDRARNRSALSHAARQGTRQLVGDVQQPHHVELHARGLPDDVGGKVGVLAQRQGDVLEHGHAAEQRSTLERQTGAQPQQLQQFG